MNCGRVGCLAVFVFFVGGAPAAGSGHNQQINKQPNQPIKQINLLFFSLNFINSSKKK